MGVGILKRPENIFNNITYFSFEELFDYEEKSKIKAGAGLSEGMYPFFTSSIEQTKFLNEYQFNKESLIFGTGGQASIHFINQCFAVSTDCLVAFAKDSSKTCVKYIYYFLSGNIHILEEGFKGAGLKHISKSYINSIKIPLPPLPLQKRITEILDTADALRKKDQELIKKYDELAQAIFVDIFGDPVKNEKGWEVMKLADCFKDPVKCGPFGSALKKSEYTMSGIPVWVMDNIQNYEFDKTQCLFISDEKFRELGSYSSNNGDIIISRAGTVGKMCVIEDVSSESIISTNLIKATFDNKRINPYYFVLLMKYFSKKIGRLRTGSDTGFTHMNTSVLNGLEIPCPPIEIQNSFVEAFSTKRKIKFITQNSDCNLFNSLLQKAFKGELLS